MTARDQPLVAILCSVPLIGVALCDALEGVAACKVISAHESDIGGLLLSLRPNAIVVDDAEMADVASRFGRFVDVAVVDVSPRTGDARVLSAGTWSTLDDDDTTPEGIRNIVAGAIYGGAVLR